MLYDEVSWAKRGSIATPIRSSNDSRYPSRISDSSAKTAGSKIVTNDFSLNKVARVQGISVLNVNELANAMKAAVLPGESMGVLIPREGKESSQGVAYLDDGSMVVVDGARRFLFLARCGADRGTGRSVRRLP